MLRVTPLYGSRFRPEGPAEDPSCTVVEFSGCRCLVNVGLLPAADDADGSGSIEFPPHDCVLLTDGTLQAVGGLPVYYQQMMRKQRQQQQSAAAKQGDGDGATDGGPASPSAAFAVPPIYATHPTIKMGQMALYDHHSALSMDGGRPAFTLDAVDAAFAAIVAIKYAQPIRVVAGTGGDGGGDQSAERGTRQSRDHPQSSLIVVQAHRAGHVVGGAFYCLQRPQDETVVVVTERYHMARESHLDAATLLQHAAAPDVLIARPGGPAFRRLLAVQEHRNNGQQPQVLVSQAERHLTEQVLAVLRRDGNVLLPADAAGRCLELLLVLNAHWEEQRLAAAYHLVWLAPMAFNVAEFARAQLEWMAVRLGHQFDSGSFGKKGGGGSSNSSSHHHHHQIHPFQLKHVQLCTSWSEVSALLNSNSNPACVVASGADLEHGPARDVFLQWADNPDNAVLLTDSAQACLRSSSSASGGGGTTRSEEKPKGASSSDLATSATPELSSPTTYNSNANSAATVAIVAPDADDPDAAAAAGGEAVVLGDALPDAASASPWTVAGQLLTAWCDAQWEQREMDEVLTVDVPVPYRAPLQGAELQQFLQAEEAQRRARQQAAQQRVLLERVEFAKGQLRLGEAAGAVGEETTTAATTPASGTTTSLAETNAANNQTGGKMTTSRPRKKSRFDSALFMKFSKPLHLMFEIREEAPGIGQADVHYAMDDGRASQVLEDDYGIAVQPERFTDIVSGVDPSKFAGGSGRIGEEVLRRGFGYAGVDGKGGGGGNSAAAKKSKAMITAGGKVVSEDEDREDEDELDERALEAVDLSEGNGIIRGRNGRPPTKVGTMLRKIEVLAEVAYIPGLEGRVGARAARQSVRALQPREVIVLGGPRPVSEYAESTDNKDANGGLKVADEVTLLAEAAKSFATGSKNILTPSNGETVELAVGHAAYGVRLIDTPYQTAEEKQAAESKPAPVEPYEAKLGACTVSLMDTVATGQKVAADGAIVLAPRLAPPTEDAPSVYLSDGDVLLTDLRAELIASGMKAEYSAHATYSQLVVNGRITVRKDHQDVNAGRMSVEGPLCEDFCAVRSIVSGQYVVL